MYRKIILSVLVLLGISVSVLMPTAVFAQSTATGVALSAYSDCDSPAGLDLSMNTDATITREGGVVTTNAGAVLMSFDQGSGFASYSGTYMGYNFSSPAWSVPAGTIVGLYAYIGSLPYSSANTIEWFVAYRCDTQQIVASCAGAYGSCPNSAASLGGGGSGECLNVQDGRLNNSSAYDCAAPVVLFLQGADADGISHLDIYGVGGGRSDLLISIPSSTYEMAPPAADRTPIENAVIPGTGQPVRTYLMLDGTVLIEAFYEDGKPYTLRFDPTGGGSIVHLAW